MFAIVECSDCTDETVGVNCQTCGTVGLVVLPKGDVSKDRNVLLTFQTQEGASAFLVKPVASQWAPIH